MGTRLTGACLCGGVRFEIDEPLESATYCHCTRCQRRTGTAASAEARPVAGSLSIVHGEELMRAHVPPQRWHELFCSRCGSALFARNPQAPDEMSVSLGAIDGDPGLRPSKRQFTDYAAVWEPIPDDGLPRFPESAWQS